ATSVPVDPYAEPAPPAAAGEGGVRVAAAPSEPAPAPPAPIVDSGTPEDPYGGDPGIRAFAEAVGATPAPAPAAPAAVPAPVPAPKPAQVKTKAKAKAAPAPDAAAALAAAATGDATVEVPAAAPPPGAPPPGAIVLARADLDAALANFSKLAASFHATFTAEGLRMDTINDGTLLAKAGLHKGDVVTAVDGRPLRSLDDAANLYARSSTVRSATVQVLRGGKPTTLRVAIQ
ncbi:MAG TPA: PDZ domain-containing protein, partial [Kofleriaceae bacterium]|nr:PDZ domain-containing protein [Kofleriaceae bacterium]